MAARPETSRCAAETRDGRRPRLVLDLAFPSRLLFSGGSDNVPCLLRTNSKFLFLDICQHIIP